jgi:hypothetical protein
MKSTLTETGKRRNMNIRRNKKEDTAKNSSKTVFSTSSDAEKTVWKSNPTSVPDNTRLYITEI